MSFGILLRGGDGKVRILGDLCFPTIEEAYLDACAAIPDAACAELRARRNPFRCAFLIADGNGQVVLEVPFTDILSPCEHETRGGRYERAPDKGVRPDAEERRPHVDPAH